MCFVVNGFVDIAKKVANKCYIKLYKSYIKLYLRLFIGLPLVESWSKGAYTFKVFLGNILHSQCFE